MLAAAAATGKIAPLLCVDEEGGAVSRVSYALDVTTHFKAMFTYREGGEKTARDNARTIGSEIADFGFNVDFAPVADVWTNPENTVIGRRAYSDDPEEAAAFISAASFSYNGHTYTGVIGTARFFGRRNAVRFARRRVKGERREKTGRDPSGRAVRFGTYQAVIKTDGCITI